MSRLFGWLASAIPLIVAVAFAAGWYKHPTRRIESPLARAAVLVGIYLTFTWAAMRVFPLQAALVVVVVLGIVVALSVLTAIAEQRVQRQRDRLAAGRCVRCGYDLRGKPTTTRCPDCGAPCVARRPRPLD